MVRSTTFRLLPLKRYRWTHPGTLRVYEAEAFPDLFGDWNVATYRGGCLRSLVRRIEIVPDEQTAIDRLHTIAKRRHSKGYLCHKRSETS